MSRYTCDACGVETDDGSNHESFCPGSPDDRIATLEERFEVLDRNVATLTREIIELQSRKKEERPMATKEKKAPRAPRNLWIVLWDDGEAVGPYRSKREADVEIAGAEERARVVGPYVLAERAREP